jgi:predicted dehydrogenase
VPHDLHAPLAVRALEAGLHVVVEKPLAVDLAAAQEIAQAAAEAERAVSVAFVFRYAPDLVAARGLVEAGALGDFRGATLALHLDKPPSYWVGGFSGRATSDWRARRERAGGGTLIMNLTHYVDFVRHLSGVEAERVAATAWAEEGREVEDAIALAVEYEGGGVGSLFGSASTRGVPAPRFELFGSTGTLVVAPEPRIYSERAVGGLTPSRWHALPTEPAVDTRTVYFERFAAAVREGRRPDVSLADGLAVQAFVEAAYRSLDEGRPVDVEPLAGVA